MIVYFKRFKFFLYESKLSDFVILIVKSIFFLVTTWSIAKPDIYSTCSMCCINGIKHVHVFVSMFCKGGSLSVLIGLVDGIRENFIKEVC